MSANQPGEFIITSSSKPCDRPLGQTRRIALYNATYVLLSLKPMPYSLSHDPTSSSPGTVLTESMLCERLLLDSITGIDPDGCEVEGVDGV